jgi:hypothetical protein
LFSFVSDERYSLVQFISPISLVNIFLTGYLKLNFMKKINYLLLLLLAAVMLFAAACGKGGAVGPQGSTGATGAQGLVGPAGPAGANGQNGSVIYRRQRRALTAIFT